jgi:hypothetical protein
MAALPAVSAATPPATRPAFKSVALRQPLRTVSSESVTGSRSLSGSRLVRGSLMISRFLSPVDERPS